jgi:PAS domain-containing protein
MVTSERATLVIPSVEAHVPEMQSLIKQGGGTTEYRLLNRDRNYIWIRDTFRVIRDDAGRPLELVGSWADIMFGPQKESPIQIESEALARDKRDAPH